MVSALPPGTYTGRPLGNAAPPPGMVPQQLGMNMPDRLKRRAPKRQPKPAGKPPVYDLKQIASDFTTLKIVTRQFDQDVVLQWEAFYRQRDPQTPFLFVPDKDGQTNLAKQIVDPMPTFLTDKGIAFNLSGDPAFSCPSERNYAPAKNLRLAEDTIAFTFAFNEECASAHFSQARIQGDIFHFGMVCGKVWYCDPTDAQRYLGGYPLKVQLCSPLQVAAEDDSDGNLRRVILAYRTTVGELPPKYKTGTLASRADSDNVSMFQDINRFKFSCVVEGEVVDTYDHGFVDFLGNPQVPFVIEYHQEMVTRQGDQPPQLSYNAPREVRVGRPVWMGLLGMARYKSFLLTAERFNIRESLTAFAVTSGQVDVDWDAKVAVGKTPDAKFTFAQPPNVLANIETGLQRVATEIEAGSASAQLMGGQPIGASGVSVQAQTTLPRQMLDAARRTHERFLARCGKMILAWVKIRTLPSGARMYKASTGQDLVPYGDRNYHDEYGNDNALPFYWWITGDVRVPVDRLTVNGITHVRCGMQPVDSLPKDQAIQLFMNIQQMEKQTGRMIVPRSYLYGELLGVSNPQAFIDQIAVDEFESDPNSPAGQVRLMREVAMQRMTDENSDTEFWAQALDNLESLSDQAYQNEFQLRLQRLQQSIAMGPPAASPPGTPNNAAPPGVNGQPPPAQSPMQPPPPNPMAQQPMPPIQQGIAGGQGTGPVPPMGFPQQGAPPFMPQGIAQAGGGM